MKRNLITYALGLLLCFSATNAAFALEAGKPMPEIGLKTLDGKNVTAKALKGKVVVLDFWATWCGPCKVELPILQKLYKKYGKDGLVIIGINIDNEPDKLKGFLSKLGVTFPIAHDKGKEVTKRYEPEKMPSSFIIGRDGVVKHVHAGFNAEDEAKFEKEIKALL